MNSFEEVSMLLGKRIIAMTPQIIFYLFYGIKKRIFSSV